MAAQPKLRRTQEERSTQMRKRLLDATVECLFENGFAGTTTTLIAERAGVSRGAQLHHFPRKEELVIGALDHLFTMRLAEFREAFSRLSPQADRGQAALDLLWPMFKGPTFYAWLELVVAARTDAVLRETVRQTTERFMESVIATFREFFSAPEAPLGPEADVIPLFAFTVLEGLALEQIVSSSHESPILNLLKLLGNFLPTGSRR